MHWIRRKTTTWTAATCALLGLLIGAANASALEQPLVAADGTQESFFGAAVAVQGDHAVVGAPFGNQEKGAVYLFTRSGDTWTETARLIASDGAEGDRLGWSVALDAGTIVAGAPGGRAGGERTGAIYTFGLDGGATRVETAKLVPAAATSAHGLGTSVAIDGATIAAGAPGADGLAGAVYTFAAGVPGEHFETAKLTASDATDGDELGTSVAIDGETIVAGAPGDDIGVDRSQGSVYTFAASGRRARNQTAKLAVAGGSDGERLGSSVGVDEATIVAGAPGDDVGENTDQGAAYTFASSGPSGRNQTGALTASDGERFDRLGKTVAIDGSVIVVGHDDGPPGLVYTFATTGAPTRAETGTLSDASGSSSSAFGFGFSIAIEGTTVLAGNPFDTIGSNEAQGSATVFFAPAPRPAVDTTPPTLTLKARRKQGIGKAVRVRASCDEACSLRATGVVRLAGERTKPKFKPVRVETVAGEVVTLSLKPSRRTAREIARSDAERGKARIEVLATDTAGNPASARVGVRLR